MKQLNLFTLKELADCYQATKAVHAVRKSLKTKKPVPTMGQVIAFPIKKVS